MAGENTSNVTMAVNKSGQVSSISFSEVDNLTGSGNYGDNQTIGTSAEQVTFPSDLTAEGISKIALFNDDATNYIQLALDSGMTNIFARLPPKRGMKFHPDSGSPTIYARANTAACVLKKVAAGT